jgi:methylphosphotriester-DNA--protein-cysteine methyltransferase
MHQHARFLLSLALGAFLAAACSERESGDTVISSTHAQVFHSPDCEWAGKIKKSNKRTFPNAEAAITAGLKPCKVCCQQAPGTPTPQPETETPVREFESLN